MMRPQDEDQLIDEDLEDVEAAPPPSDEELNQVRALARTYLDLEAEIADLGERMKAKQLALKNVRENQLPLALTTIGMESFKLVGGGEVSLKKLVAASIIEANRAAAFAALEANNHGDVIKHEIKVLFGKGEEKWAQKFLRDLQQRKKPLNVARRDFVEPQTLMKLARELVEQARAAGLDPAQAFPGDLYRLMGVYEMKFAEVKLPKAK